MLNISYLGSQMNKTDSISPQDNTVNLDDGSAITQSNSTEINRSSKRYYILFLLSVVCALAYMDRFVLSVLVEPIKLDLDLSDTQVGLLTGLAFALFYALFGIPFARLADRYSRSKIIAASVTLWSVMTAASGYATNFIQLLFARIGVGVGEAGCFPASHAFLADLFPGKQKAFAIGIFQAGGTIGILAGLILGGILSSKYGWHTTFIVLGLPGVLIGLVLWLTVDDKFRGKLLLKTSDDSQDDKSLIKTINTLLNQKAYRNLLIGLSIGSFSNYGVIQWLPSFFIRSHEVTIDEIGVIYGMVVGLGTLLGTLAGALFAPKLIEKDQKWEVLWGAYSYLLVIPLFVSCFLVTNINLSFVLLFIGLFVITSGTGPSYAAIQSLASPKMRATAVALIMLAMSIVGQGFGPLFVGMLSDMLAVIFGEQSLRYALCISMFIMVWGFVHLFISSKNIKKEAQ